MTWEFSRNSCTYVRNRQAIPPSWIAKATKSYARQKHALFEDRAFYELKNAQAVVVAYDGVNPLPPTYCYLKPDFLPVEATWFEQERSGFMPRRKG